MKIYNKEKTQILAEESVNLNLGRLIPEKIVISQKKASTTQIETEEGVVFVSTPESIVTEDILVYVPYTDKELKEKQIEELEEWFSNEYRYQFEKYSRKITLGLLMRDGSNPAVRLSELYAIAETKAQTLHALREQL